jgi:hypothetical protein
MFFHGIITGLIAFFAIGLFHPVIIKTEYHFGVKVWPVFLAAGAVLCGVSLFLENVIVSGACGILGFCSLWSIHELFQQRERVKKGWFPRKSSKKNQ